VRLGSNLRVRLAPSPKIANVSAPKHALGVPQPESVNPVNIVLRVVAASGLATLAFAVPAGAEDMLPVKAPSATGSYLAGQQALAALATPDAATFFRDASQEQWDNAEVVTRAFSAYAANGDVDQAVTAARHALDLDKNNDLARLIIATDAVKQRRYDAAVDLLNTLGSDSFEGLTGTLLKAWALTGEGKVNDAFAVLDRLGQGGMEEFLLFHRAIMADVAGRQPEAIKYITEAHDADPFTADVVEAYARIMGNAGQFQKGIDAIVAFEGQGLDSPLVTVVQQSLARSQRPGLFADNVQDGAAEMYHSLGVAFARQGSTDVAMVLMRLAQYLNPRNDNVTLTIGQLYDGAQQFKLANAIYDTLSAGSPMRPLATVRIADNLDAMGNRPEAIRRLEGIVSTNPTDIDAISVLGDLYRSDKRYDDAINAYTKVMSITGGNSPGDWRFYYVRGIAHERNKQFPLAENDFLKALQLDPGQPQVLNYLGYSWVDRGMNLKRALEMIQKAVAASPNDGYIIDSLGWAYYRLGRYPEAVTELEAAATLRPNDPEINDHLGDAYWQVGRKLEAKFQWNVAFSLDTEGDVKARVGPKLKGGLTAAPHDGESAPVIDTPAASAQPIAAPAN
jgi:tetratricopeptide (TPR) repeat protein